MNEPTAKLRTEVRLWDGWFGKRWFGVARFDGAATDAWQGPHRKTRVQAFADTVWWRLRRRWKERQR